MLKSLYAGCFGLFPVISVQFTAEVGVTAENRKKSHKSPAFWISGSFKVIDVGTSEKLVSSACCGKQQDYVYLQPFSR